MPSGVASSILLKRDEGTALNEHTSRAHGGPSHAEHYASWLFFLNRSTWAGAFCARVVYQKFLMVWLSASTVIQRMDGPGRLEAS